MPGGARIFREFVMKTVDKTSPRKYNMGRMAKGVRV